MELDSALNQDSELGDVFTMNSQNTVDDMKKINIAPHSLHGPSQLHTEES